MKQSYDQYIEIRTTKRSGQACIKGTRITIKDIMSYLSAGMTTQELIEDFPSLTPESITAAKAYTQRNKLEEK